MIKFSSSLFTNILFILPALVASTTWVGVVCVESVVIVVVFIVVCVSMPSTKQKYLSFYNIVEIVFFPLVKIL